ncbi:hypothetical protein [Actinophytocola xinjiangensis]|uniref:hypothetical protein n=1 Tax=Actinophytocola xinjiangensis TaxID=485602 RepID=UPI000B32EBEC|nr:hypothetical protein [Actinophytocola xinjiangensis]
MAEQNGAWHDTLTLISDLSSVNKRIATFVLRVLDADAGGGSHRRRPLGRRWEPD